MNKTSNYQLCQWDGEDRILRTDFNEDNAKIDAALKQQANSIAGINSTLPGKADAATVTSLTNKLNTEIQNRKDADTAEANARAQADNTEKAAREAADTAEAQARAQGDAALTAAMALKGNVQAEVKTYTGNGKVGSTNSNSLTFSKQPLAFFIGGDEFDSGFWFRGCSYLWFCGGNGLGSCQGSWSGNTYSWYSSYSGKQLNNYGETYTVVALYAADE